MSKEFPSRVVIDEYECGFVSTPSGSFDYRKAWTKKLPDWLDQTEEYLSLKEHAHLMEQKQKRIERLEDALRFYADGEGDVLDWDRVNNPACIQDRGKRAREALSDKEG